MEGVVVVFGGEYLVAGPQLEALDDECDPHRRAVRQGDLRRLRAEIAGDRLARLRAEPDVGHPQGVLPGVGIQALAERGDGVPDRRGVGRQHEGRKVGVVPCELELGTYRLPAARVERITRGGARAGCGETAKTTEHTRSGERSSFQQGAPTNQVRVAVPLRHWPGPRAARCSHYASSVVPDVT